MVLLIFVREKEIRGLRKATAKNKKNKNNKNNQKQKKVGYCKTDLELAAD